MNDFKSVVGHKAVVKNLISALNNGKTSHAYIISGMAGVGKMTIAKAFARALQCENYDGDSCGKCISCQSFDSGNHPDVFYVMPKKTRALSVDDIREQVIKQSEIKQYKYKYKVFIVDKADTMTPQAQNALLKTLEEPPSYAVILLLAENTASFLPTILSRCVMLKLNPLSSKQVKNYIKLKEGADEKTASLYAEYAQGSVGKALELYSDSSFAEKRENVIKNIVSASEGDVVSAINCAKQFEIYKEDKSFTDIITLFFRDVIVFKTTRDENLVIQKDILEDVKKISRKFKPEQLIKKYEAARDFQKQLKSNASFNLSCEVLMMKINDKTM